MASSVVATRCMEATEAIADECEHLVLVLLLIFSLAINV